MVVALEEAERALARRSGPRRSPGTASMKSFTWSISVGRNSAASATIPRIAPTNVIITATPRRFDAVLLQPDDGRVEREREEDGDHDPDQHAARDLDDLDQR